MKNMKNNKYLKDIGDACRKFRESKGLTIEDIVYQNNKEFGSQGHVSNFEKANGKAYDIRYLLWCLENGMVLEINKPDKKEQSHKKLNLKDKAMEHILASDMENNRTKINTTELVESDIYKQQGYITITKIAIVDNTTLNKKYVRILCKEDDSICIDLMDYAMKFLDDQFKKNNVDSCVALNRILETKPLKVRFDNRQKPYCMYEIL